MKRHERERLLEEILGGEEVSGFRQVSLDRGLAAVRQSRRRRLALRSAALIAIPVLLAAAVLVRPWRHRQVAPAPPGPVASNPSVPPPARSAPSVKFITDEELFALFPDRSMALIGPPGHQQLVFLDQAGARKGGRGL